MGGEMTVQELRDLAAIDPAANLNAVVQRRLGKRHTEAVQHSSKLADWRTPTSLFAALDQEFGFVLDAAADKTSKLCPHYCGPDSPFEAQRNGQTCDWATLIDQAYEIRYPLSRTAVFLNPPFSREQAAAYRNQTPPDFERARSMEIAWWVEKCWWEAQAGCTVVGVIPYSPQTRWWKTYVEGMEPEEGLLANFFAAREVRKIPHRVSFLRPDGTEAENAGNNTAICVWRPKYGIQSPWVPWSCYWDYE